MFLGGRRESTPDETSPERESLRRKLKTHPMRLRSDTRDRMLDDSDEIESMENARSTPRKEILTLTGILNPSDCGSLNGLYGSSEVSVDYTEEALGYDLSRVSGGSEAHAVDCGTYRGEGGNSQGNSDEWEFAELSNARRQREQAFQNLKDTIRTGNEKLLELIGSDSDKSQEFLETLRSYISEVDEDIDRLKVVENVADLSRATDKRRSDTNIEDWDLTPGDTSISLIGDDNITVREVLDEVIIGRENEADPEEMQGCRVVAEEDADLGMELIEFEDAVSCSGHKRWGCCRLS